MNPELQRQLWLNISKPKLIAMPLVILLLVALIGVSTDWDRGDVSEWLLLLGVALSAGLGASGAAQSMLDELRLNTWDWQRLSALGAWEMTWGKLVGGALFGTYGGVLCYAGYVLAGGASRVNQPALLVVAIALLVSFMTQAVSLLTACGTLYRSASRTSSAGHAALGLASWLFATWATTIATRKNIGGLRWYEIEWSAFTLVASTTALLLGWALLGAYRTLRAQLQVPTAPWVWVSFVLCMALYLAGFLPIEELSTSPSKHLLVRGFTANAIVVLFAYAAVLAATMETTYVHRVALLWQRSGLRGAAIELPAWAGTLALSLLTTLVVVFLSQPLPTDDVIPLSATSIAMFALLLRDTALIFWFRMRAGGPSKDVWLAVVLGCVHVVLPITLDQAGLDTLRAIFSLHPRAGWQGASIMLVESAFCVWLTSRSWSRYVRASSAA